MWQRGHTSELHAKERRGSCHFTSGRAQRGPSFKKSPCALCTVTDKIKEVKPVQAIGQAPLKVSPLPLLCAGLGAAVFAMD